MFVVVTLKLWETNEETVKLSKQKQSREVWLYGEGEYISGLTPNWAQMVKEQDVTTCTFAHKLMHAHTHTY